MRPGHMVALFILCASAGAAETVAVRGGEHPDFTRLVLDLPATMPWEVTRTGKEAVVALPRADLVFELGDAFDRISRTRIAALVSGPTPGALTLQLGCACPVDSFLHEGRMLVIDVSDPPESGRAPPETPVLPLLPERAPRAIPAATVVAPSLPTNLAPAERALAQALGRGVSQALLRPAGGQGEESQGVVPAPDPVAATTAPEPRQSSSRPVDTAQLALRTPFLEQRFAIGSDTEPPDCVPDQLLDVDAWADGTAFAEQIGRHRRALYREFDRHDPAAAATLTRLFVHMGFGAEAKAMLPLTTLAPPERAALDTMAGILDRIGVPSPDGRDSAGPGSLPGFSGQTGCPGAAALWAVLEPRRPPVGATIDTGAVRRAFQNLPLHLRRHIAPDLAARLRASGNAPAAADVLRAIVSVTPEPSPALDLARAQDALAVGRASEAEPILAEIAKAGGTEGPQALAALIEARIAAGRPIEAETALLAASHARENRDQALGPRLRRAHILALIGAGDLDAALQEVSRMEAANLAIDRNGILGPLWQALADAPDDASFLRRVLTAGQAPEDLPVEARAAVSARLLRLGLPEVAQVWLPAPDAADTADAARLLQAEAALELGRTNEAEVLLAGLTGAEADELRARIRASAGDHAGAAKLYAALGQDEAAARQRFLADMSFGAHGAPRADPAPSAPSPPTAPGNLSPRGEMPAAGMQAAPPDGETRPDAGQDAAPEPDPTETIAATATAPPPTAEGGVLARNRALIEESAATRQALADLLDRVTGPAEMN